MYFSNKPVQYLSYVLIDTLHSMCTQCASSVPIATVLCSASLRSFLRVIYTWEVPESSTICCDCLLTKRHLVCVFFIYCAVNCCLTLWTINGTCIISLCTQICLFALCQFKKEHPSHCVFSFVQLTTPLCVK